ncbi:class I SAM-dependent methyltransferase [Dissulfurispira sp.]|uniref:class I SAM-dependent methyltransferase n=1 Tax=Dissulfurispira sp. TaxID=2817609 RepID=UPI002FD9BDBC
MRLEHQKICELLRKEKKGYLLDAACGKGELGSALEDMGFEVFFMDRYDSPANKKKFVKADINHFLPFREEAIDFLVCSESLQYVENHKHVFSEFHRVLKKEGMLIISLPNMLSVSSRLFFLRRGYFPHFKPYKAGRCYKEWSFLAYNPISFVEIFQLMKKLGFEPRHVIASGTRLKGLWLYPILKALYLIGSLFNKNDDNDREYLIKGLASRELLTGDHIIICGIKTA